MLVALVALALGLTAGLTWARAHGPGPPSVDAWLASRAVDPLSVNAWLASRAVDRRQHAAPSPA